MIKNIWERRLDYIVERKSKDWKQFQLTISWCYKNAQSSLSNQLSEVIKSSSYLNDVSRGLMVLCVLQGCFKDVLKICERYFRVVFRDFPGNWKDLWRVIKEMDVSNIFQGSFRGVNGSFKGVLRVFQMCFKVLT